MSEKRPRGTDEYPDDDGQDELGGRRVRVIRSLRMSEDERRARERREARFLSHLGLRGNKKTKESSDNAQEGVGGRTESTTEARELESSQQPPVAVVKRQERKPWESLVIGSLGENLSHIERKNREIEQQRFIVQFHEQHSPHEVDHNRRILNQLLQERAEMEDNEENNMPQYREKSERISRRLELLRWVLDNSKCEDERINVTAAIQGYESGQIPYSPDFTLLCAGHIVDRCPNYTSFSMDRNERLERYFARHGPGWLWQEPPLAGPGNDVLGMKGTCLDREFEIDKYHIGTYQVTLELRIQRGKVSKGKSHAHSHETGHKDANQTQNSDASCRLGTLLDSGATFPIILESDLARLNMDLSRYPPQGVMDVNIVGGKSKLKFYEMYVSVCSEDGSSLIGQGDEAVWPTEPRSLGGFCPVLAQPDPAGSHVSFVQRLSGMIPFDACYISSAPSMARVWLGEDRRDVLGTSRLPAHLRFDTDKKFIFEYPQEFETLRQAARTPDRVIFVHEFPDQPDLLLIDSDTAKVRGKSELAIGQYQDVIDGPGKKPFRKAVPHRVLQVEPRKGGIKTVPKETRPRWRRDFVKPA
ncbi:hypothetical protein F4824DRAFT_496885 [Ustulina deusta]|nr:hypothetical protein F4824DRAFT_496885 [Ustulina deusta]